jgi:hypothetical protein
MAFPVLTIISAFSAFSVITGLPCHYADLVFSAFFVISTEGRNLKRKKSQKR